MSATLYYDIETYCVAKLSDVGAYRYAEDPSCEILMAGWARDDGPVQVAVGEAEIACIPGLFDPGVLKVAHNAAFDRTLTRARLDWMGDQPIESWCCTMALASEWGYPRSLENLGPALGLPRDRQKNMRGKYLLRLLSQPNRKGEREMPEDHPAEWAELIEYCRQDVVTLREVYKTLPAWPPGELKLWRLDQKINDRGMAVDVRLAAAARDRGIRNKNELIEKVRRATGIDNPGSTHQLNTWARTSGLDMPDWRAETVARALASATPGSVEHLVLEARQSLALSASSKFGSALERVCDDGRLYGAFQFYGAHTGRWAGRGVQPQNLPREALGKGLSPEAAETEVEAHIADLLLGLPTDQRVLKALVRGLFSGPLTVVDFSAIEARVLAWLAGEQWSLDAFAAGKDIYTETASRMGGLTRQEGKVAVLALGYGGAAGALRSMAGDQLPEEKLLPLVRAWRKANRKVVQFWEDLENAFYYGGRSGAHVEVTVDKDNRHIVLPSGRSLVYRGVRYTSQGLRFASPTPPVGSPTKTYGGRLAENVTQAVARDLLAAALVRLDAAGFDIVGHVHDEVIVDGSHDVPRIADIMCDSPAWAGGLPVGAAGYVCAHRYRKG